MDELEITRELRSKIIGYIVEKGYAYNTILAYKRALQSLLGARNFINKEIILNYLKKHTHPNERSIVNIINQVCSLNNIDFNIVIPIIKQKPRKIPDILSMEEIKIMVDSTPKPYDLMLRCVFGLGAGLRISEIIKLCWSNIRWAEWLANKEYGVALLKETKRDTERVVNIPNEIMEDLYALARQKQILNEFGIPNGSLIFPMSISNYKPDLYSVDKEKWKNEYIRHAYNWFRYNILEKCCEKALNKRIHIHMLRHSRATYLYEVERLPIERIQQLLGHKDLKTTMIYTRIDPKSTFNMMKDTKVI